MELKDVDLNLLVVFSHVLAERRLSRVADLLGLTQPAVSNALARLRKRLNDPLFIRTSSGMEPTPYAEQLGASVTGALELIRGAINRSNAFDPARASRSFNVGMTDIGEIYFLPRLMERVRQLAPGISFSTVRNAAVNLKEEMEAGKIDLALGLLPQLKAGFFRRRLFRQRYVCLMRRGHRLDRKRISLADFSAAEHVVIVTAGTGHGKVEKLLNRSGVKRKVRLVVPHYVAIGHILQATDLIATVPERFAERMTERFGLSSVRHPARLPVVAISAFWHARFHNSPANQWLREVIFELFVDEGS